MLTNARSTDPSESAAAFDPEQAQKRFDAKIAPHPSGCIVWTASLWKQGYGQFYFAGRAQKAHRVAYELAYGPIPLGVEIDHICFRRECVNLAHLRPVTRKQNMEHRNGANANSKSGVRGVSWHKRMGKWSAYVRHNKIGHHVGYFDSIDEAGAAVLAKRNELFSHNDEVAA